MADGKSGKWDFQQRPRIIPAQLSMAVLRKIGIEGRSAKHVQQSPERTFRTVLYAVAGEPTARRRPRSGTRRICTDIRVQRIEPPILPTPSIGVRFVSTRLPRLILSTAVPSSESELGVVRKRHTWSALKNSRLPEDWPVGGRHLKGPLGAGVTACQPSA